MSTMKDGAGRAWQDDGACRGAAPGLMFPDDADEIGEAAAKVVCDRCRVVEACLAWALTHIERDGVWGGMTESERRRYRRQLLRRAQQALVERAAGQGSLFDVEVPVGVSGRRL